MKANKTEIFAQWESSKEWKRKQGVYVRYPLSEKFVASIQWPAKTPRTKNMPRPVINVCKRILGYKVSSTMRQKLKAIYTPQEVSELTDNEEEKELIDIAKLMTNYYEVLMDRLEDENQDERVLTKSGTVGSCYVHDYWDNSVIRGNTSESKGELASEVIDSMNVHLGNPQEADNEKQPWIIIEQPKPVKELIQMAIEAGVPENEAKQIGSDYSETDERYEKERDEISVEQKGRLYTRYRKVREQVETKTKDKNGNYEKCWTTKIYYLKATKSVEFGEEKEVKGHTLYPIYPMVWEERTADAYGISEIEHIIPNQRAINFLVAMMLLAAEKAGMPQLVVDDNAITKNITNAPGAVHRIDTKNNNGNVANAMRYLEPGSISVQLFSLLTTLIELTKEMSGATEDALGERGGAQLNATAIIRLQEASAIPLETTKRNYKKFKKNQAQVRMEFFVNRYTKRTITVKDDEGNRITADFNPATLENARFDIGIDVGTDTKYSSELSEASLKGLLDAGLIDLMKYLKYADKKVAPFADQMLQEIKQEQGITDDPNANMDNVQEVITQIQEMEPQQREQMLSMDIEEIMSVLSEILQAA